MNRINELFKRKQKDLLSIYFCAGAPTLDGTMKTITALEANGVDMIEVGIPFSDPMADGPVIQQASCTALNNGMSLKLLIEQMKDLRKTVSLPIIFMGYLNVVYKFGFEKFCQTCDEIGIDGMILPELPFDDYIKNYKPIVDKYNVKVIMLISPDTPEHRIREIDQNTDAFIYMVSSASTTGAQNKFSDEAIAYFERIKSMKLKNPTMIGFGISNKQTFEAAKKHSSGAIIGSKFVSLLKESNDANTAIKNLKKCIEQ